MDCENSKKDEDIEKKPTLMVADIYMIINVENVYTVHTICSVARCGHHMFESYFCYWNNISSVIILLCCIFHWNNISSVIILLCYIFHWNNISSVIILLCYMLHVYEGYECISYWANKTTINVYNSQLTHLFVFPIQILIN